MSIPITGAGLREVEMCLPGKGLEGPHRDRGLPPILLPDWREWHWWWVLLPWLWSCLLTAGTGSGMSTNSWFCTYSSWWKLGDWSPNPKATAPGRVLFGAYGFRGQNSGLFPHCRLTSSPSSFSSSFSALACSAGMCLSRLPCEKTSVSSSVAWWWWVWGSLL